jgi:hypothetical protein
MSGKQSKGVLRLLGIIRKLKKENRKLVLDLMELRARVEELEGSSGEGVLSYST